MAFTDFEIEMLQGLIEIHKENPDLLKRSNAQTLKRSNAQTLKRSNAQTLKRFTINPRPTGGCSDVRFQGHSRSKAAPICSVLEFRCAGEEARLIDVCDQALMRGLDMALPNMRPRLSLSYWGRRQCRPQSIRREFLCRCLAPTLAPHMEAERGSCCCLCRLEHPFDPSYAICHPSTRPYLSRNHYQIASLHVQSILWNIATALSRNPL
jgi:hypothetical protein